MSSNLSCRTAFATLVAMLGVVSSPTSRAQELRELADMSLEELLLVSTTTASGGAEEGRAKAAGNVTVISSEEIHQNGWRSVAEVLAHVPGLYLSDDGSLTSVAVRGVSTGLNGGSRLVKIMINGTPVNFRPELRAFLGPEYIPMAVVERIEVVKGPLSALYGANAFVATVNVVTRVPKVGTNAEVSGRFITTQGNPGRAHSLMVSHSSENVHVLLAVTSTSVDRSGLSVQQTFAAQDPASPRYGPYFAESSRYDFSNPEGAFGQLEVPTAHYGTFRLEGGIQQHDANTEFRLNSVLTHESRESLQNNWLTARHEKLWSQSVGTQISVGYGQGEPTRDDKFRLSQNRSRTFTRNFDYRAYNAAVSADYSPTPRFSAKLGVDGEADDEGILFYTATLAEDEGVRLAGDQIELIPPATSRRELFTDLGAYLQLRGQPIGSLPKLELTGNGRVDRVSSGDFNPPLQLSARAGVVYEWSESLVTKVVAGRAFQSPSGVLLFAQPGFGVENNVIGNLTAGSTVPSLEPQTLDSIEGTLYLVLGNVAALELSGFYQRLNKKIDFRTSGTDYVARNAGAATYAGLEGMIQLDLDPIVPFVNVATISRLDGDVGDSLPAYPSYIATGAVNVDLSSIYLHLNTRVRVVGPREATVPNVLFNQGQPYSLPRYATWDATLSSTALPLLGPEQPTHLTLSVQNALDQRYSEAGFGGFDTPAQGRSAFIEVKQAF